MRTAHRVPPTAAAAAAHARRMRLPCGAQEHVGAMQESFASKLNLLTDKVDKLVAAMEASQPSQGSGGGVSYSIG